jgi:hypothetical protein
MLINPLKKPSEPSVEEVKKYLKKWDDNEAYPHTEKCLSNLFKKFPSNNNLEEIIIKVCTLDVIYSANVSRWFFPISKHILNYDFDNKIKNKQFDVNNFSLTNIKGAKSKSRNFYSFATKYCCHHDQTDYPIYDYYVDEVLWYFMKEELNHKRRLLKGYIIFKQTLEKFIQKYNLNQFTLREVDKYIWLLGKEFFKRQR